MKCKDKPSIVIQNGKSEAVRLDIDRYREMLKQPNDLEDLKVLAEMPKKSLRFRRGEEFPQEPT